MDNSGQYLMKTLHTQEAMDHPAVERKKGMSASVTLRQRLKILHDNPRPALLRVIKRQAVLQVRAGAPTPPPAGTARVPGHRRVPPPGQHSPWWPSAPPPAAGAA